MRTAVHEYVGILVKFLPAQVEALDHIKDMTGKDRTSLIREAVQLLIGRYLLAEKELADAEMAEILGNRESSG